MIDDWFHRLLETWRLENRLYKQIWWSLKVFFSNCTLVGVISIHKRLSREEYKLKCQDRYMEPSKRIKPLPIVITHNLKHHLHCSVCVRAHAWDLVAHATFMTSTIGRLLTTQQKRQSLSAGVQIPILISHITANDHHRLDPRNTQQFPILITYQPHYCYDDGDYR